MTPPSMESTSNASEPSRRALAEASAWLARLHRPQRLKEDEAGFRHWVAERPEHARAWELANEMWENAQRIPLGTLVPSPSRRSEVKGNRRRWYFALATVLVLSIATLIYLLVEINNAPLRTGIGERRVVTLEDGTRVAMNTSTQVIVQYSDQSRRVHLLTGEALFEVTKNKQRPFVVQFGNREVTALGTSFVVRADKKQSAVTLVEGQVAITPLPGLQQLIDDRPPPQVLAPGERVTFTEDEPPARDRPALDTVMSWQRGVSTFDNTPLIDAAAEMNRYNAAARIDVSDTEVGQLPVSGVFRLGDSSSFARAVAHGYSLQVREEEGRILIGPGSSVSSKQPQ